MAFDDLIRSGVALAHTLTASLQDTVTLAAWTGQNAFGDKTYASPVSYSAIIEHKQRYRQTATGQVVLTQTSVQFLEPIIVNGAAGRTEPIDTRDILTLPDGSTAPIVAVEGVVDPDANSPYAPMVWLGSR